MLAAPAPLSANHDLSRFDCGRAELNDWLRRRAQPSEGTTARTYVTAVGRRVVGYYALSAGNAIRSVLPSAKLRRNTPDQVPVIVLTRLAVDRKFQGRSIGKGLLKDAVGRTAQASQTIGLRALLVHAIDDGAAAFYIRHGFVPTAIDHLTLLLPIETVIASLT